MSNKGNPFLILLIAIAIVAAVSLLPLNKLSDGRLKDFSLISDILKTDSVNLTNANTYIDPDLENALAEIEAESDSTTENIQDNSSNNLNPSKSTGNDSLIIQYESFDPNIPAGEIEDYTPEGRGLSHLAQAIRQASDRPARIAMLGDSYIEGDILSEVVREKLQSKYGGCGAGYVPLSSNITGFRNSIRQQCANWKEYDFRKNGKSHTTLQGVYFSPDGEGKTVVKGSRKKTHTSDWLQSRLLFISPSDSEIIFYSAGSEPIIHNITGSPEVQCITIDAPTSEITVECSDSEVKMLGLYLDGNNGVALDNMSIRGYAGIRHNCLNLEIAAQSKPFIDYDLIILEYGINALTAEQTEYNSYTKVLGRSIDRIRMAYPNADILLMGIGDRGIKHNGEVISMPTVRSMIDAQRKLARDKGLLFWDTCKAMGGQGSVVEWAKEKNINKDYIHLSRTGGNRLGKILSEAIENKMDE